MADDARTNLLLPFDVDDSEFSRGFECGRIWALLRVIQMNGMEPTEDYIHFTVHWSNAEMMLRISEALGMTCRTQALDETFCEVIFEELEELA